jgi:hypothetical protein
MTKLYRIVQVFLPDTRESRWLRAQHRQAYSPVHSLAHVGPQRYIVA